MHSAVNDEANPKWAVKLDNKLAYGMPRPKVGDRCWCGQTTRPTLLLLVSTIGSSSAVVVVACV